MRRIVIGDIQNITSKDVVQSFNDEDTNRTRHEIIVPENIRFWDLLGLESRKVRITYEVID